jgi:hypothetical protein
MILGQELVSNGTFDSDLSGWEATASGFEFDTESAMLPAGSEGTLSQSIGIVAGKSYQVSFNYKGVTGDCSLSTQLGGTYLSITPVQGVNTEKVAAGSSNTNIHFSGVTGESSQFAIDTVSVREVISEITGSGHSGWYPRQISASSKERSSKKISTAYGTMPIKKDIDYVKKTKIRKNS